MESVIHLTLNAKEGEGKSLSKIYKTGAFYPIFILVNGSGDVISRWTGYTGPRRFINSLKKAMSDLVTVNERIIRLETNPTLDDALFLAGYEASTAEFLKAVEYYREAQKLSGGDIYSFCYQIFENTANAAWNNMIDFEKVLPVADLVLDSTEKNRNNIIKTAKVMSNLARKKDKTDQLAKYLKAGIDASANSSNKRMQDSHNQLIIDQILYVEKDVEKATATKKSSLGNNWQNDPEQFYTYAKWCSDRKINLEEAEMYARKAISLAIPGKFKGKIYRMLADISEARGNFNKAAEFMALAIDENPTNDSYVKKLKLLQENPKN